MLILMGYSPNGGTSKTTLKRLIDKFNIDVKHIEIKRYSED